MQVSKNGLDFITAHEGFVSRAYLCPAGVLTIGYGFTMRSGVFSAYWRAKYGRGLQKGDTITRAEADQVLLKLLASEYAPPVEKVFGVIPQHQFDAAVSVVYNLGPRALGWKWAEAFKAGRIDDAARLLSQTGIIATGRYLPGLKRRRTEEAELLLSGKYPGLSSDPRDAGIESVQEQLNQLGFSAGKVDGVAGKQTREAIKAFQRANDLVIDGIAGPATRAALDRLTKSRLRREIETRMQPASSGFFVALITAIAAALKGIRK